MSAAAKVAVAAVLLGIAVGISGYMYGLDQGKAAERGRQDKESLTALTQQITAHARLVKSANAASRDLRRAVLVRAQADQKSSQELSHELIATADSRAGCVFPIGVMRNIAVARERAAQAAASGIERALPATDASAPAER